MQTEKMAKFISKNSAVKIEFGERLTPEGKTIFTKVVLNVPTEFYTDFLTGKM